MKSLNDILSLIVLLVLSVSCNAQPGSKAGKSDMVLAESVEVFYFHNTRRCATCQAVETESTEILK